jgi:hypothetical protein
MADRDWTTTEPNYFKFKHVGDNKFINEAPLASATTIVPLAYHSLLTGTTDVVTITIPYTGFKGTIAITPTASGPGDLELGGNIAAHVNMVRYQTVFLTYSEVNALWYPSYV